MTAQEEAAAFAARHGLEALHDAAPERFAALLTQTAEAGAALPRLAEKHSGPASLFRPGLPARPHRTSGMSPAEEDAMILALARRAGLDRAIGDHREGLLAAARRAFAFSDALRAAPLPPEAEPAPAQRIEGPR